MTIDEILKSFASVTRDPIGVSYHRTGDDDKGLFIWMNAGFETQFGYSGEHSLNMSAQDLVAPEDRAAFLATLRPHLQRGDGHFVHNALCRRRDGSDFWASLAISLLPLDENGGRFSLAIYRDFHELKSRELLAEPAVRDKRALLGEAEAAKSRLLLAIDAIPCPLVIWDKDLRLVICNSAFARRLLGSPKRPEVGTSIEEILQDVARSGQIIQAVGREDEWCRAAIETIKLGPIDEETTYSDGRTFRSVSTIAPNGDTVVFTTDITEITEKKQALEIQNMELELARAEADLRALHDDLTCLGNRRFVIEGLAELLREREVYGGEVAVLTIDLDRFKQINDTQGHAAGDLVLSDVAGRLRRVVRPGDLLARIGGDEFVILCRVADSSMPPERLGERIVEAMRKPFRYEDVDLRLGASVGIAMTPLSSPDDLLTNADVALYKAKSSGRSAVITFEERDLREICEARALADELLESIEKKRFLPLFQPQIEVETGRILGLEALARWQHPKRGSLPPSDFMIAARDLNVMAEIDAIIIDKSLEYFTNGFSADLRPNLSFNLCEESLLSGALTRIAGQAEAYQGRISIELLETILFEDNDEVFEMQLDLIRDMGLGIEIDDFGSGRASIVALEKIAPDRLKIDRRLVWAVADSDRSANLVKAIVDIGRALGIGVTAEGVETIAQAGRLASLGCDRLQGHLYGAPAPFDAIREILGGALSRNVR